MFSYEIKQNKYIHYKKNNLNNLKKINHISSLRIKKESIQNRINFFKDNIIKNNNNKKIIFLLDFQNILSLSERTNKIYSIFNNKNTSYILNKDDSEALRMQKVILKDSENFIRWKNFINDRILLLIGNKNSEAKINFRSNRLGYINILIHIQDNAIILNFISKYNTVRTFLDNCMPFLCNSLKKKGIKLEKYNIFSSLQHQEINNYTNFSDKNNYFSHKYPRKTNMYEKKNNFRKYPIIDCYV
ncbi:hypothetical protein D9V74_00375 [Buchnera aphidicola (Macrosiphoniella sanborni)]|uniref:Flagellar hook-length control protein-like C-terminal domain-containing protein n=1 Tax=Buchnera aphidicola (Macrosiphoniella sanborni) TaxID=1241865 RepID=A0A4D6Y2C2_9GAMM|nr:flagellar hook-length control protein FliK [Buchnera aphidicola]QCI23646.1 hypothetical protein D9V74_00375 [Buchnera aphidicola (Macrosiphoniella sanborni)]